jgi:hypothetical protein
MSQPGIFGDAVLLMASCLTENVSIQLFTWNSHQSNVKTVQTLSSQTFSPVKVTSTTKKYPLHLDTGDSIQIKNSGRVIGNRVTRAPHYDTLRRRTPLSDITNRTTVWQPSPPLIEAILTLYAKV